MDSKYVFNKSVMGSIHILKNIPCQDFSTSFKDEYNRYAIAIVADGHGDRSCFRSDYGSKAVCETALECLKEFAEAVLDSPIDDDKKMISLLLDKRQSAVMIKQLTDSIISKWHINIKQNLSENEVRDEELENAGTHKEAYINGKRLEHIYGTTLIAALQFNDFLVLIQQGDGRCDVIYENGVISQPIPWDEKCHENVTTSICDSDAAERIRHCVIDLTKQNIIACYLGSDGVEDSYYDMEGTHTFYKMLTCDIIDKSSEEFESYLIDYLPKFSKSGSGDDISIAGIIDNDRIKEFYDVFKNSSKIYNINQDLNYYSNKYNSMQRKYDFLLNKLYTDRRKKDKLEELNDANPERFVPAIAHAKKKFKATQEEFDEYNAKYHAIKIKIEELSNCISELSLSGNCPDKRDIN